MNKKEEINIVENKVENEQAKEIEIKIRNKKYTEKEIKELINKKKKTFEEKEKIKEIKEVIDNYIAGILYALYGRSNNKQNALELLKEKIKKDPTICEIINLKCDSKYNELNEKNIKTIINIFEYYSK